MSGNIRARSNASEMSISAIITRADGRIEDLGTISYWHKNPLRRWAFKARRLFKNLISLKEK